MAMGQLAVMIQDLGTNLKNRIDGLEKRIDQVNQKLDDLNKK